MSVKIVVPFHPIDVKGKEDYLKFTADVTGGEMVPVSDYTKTDLVKKIVGQNIHVHGRGLPFPETACLFARRKIYTPHFNVVGVTNRSSILRSRLWNRYEKIIALTKYARDNFVREGIKPNKIEQLPLPIDYRKYQSIGGGKSFRKKFGLGNKEPFALVIGLRKGKNTDVIAQACSKVGIRCVMVGFTKKSDSVTGAGWLMPPKSLTENKDDSIILTGKLSDREILAAMDAATMYVNSSDHTFECFSLSTYQCAASGVPMCLPDFGVFDIFKGAALFHDNKNPNQLAANIKKYLGSGSLRRKNSKSARKIAKTRDYPKVRETYEQFYRRIGYI